MSKILQKLDLAFNPFEPSATGPPLGSTLFLPKTLAKRVRHLLDLYQTGPGVKIIVIVGEYGSGKTCLLQWLHNQVLPKSRIKSFYFDNPGVQFYDLANALLRDIGRKEFAKFIWEFAGPHVSTTYQGHLFQRSFEEYLSAASRPGQRQDVAGPLQMAVMKAGITSDEEIAHCLARIVADAVTKPYFEYRDFVPRQSGSLVAEAEEAPYFRALLKTICRGAGANAVAFLIDEFEEIGLQKRLTRRAAHDYLATLKRLINLAQNEASDFWLILSMTEDAYDTTRELEPALADRFSGDDHLLRVQPMDFDDAVTLVRSRMDSVRSEVSKHRKGSLFPFQEEILFSRNTYSNPRRLVKACFFAISSAVDETHLPFSEVYLQNIEGRLFPVEHE